MKATELWTDNLPGTTTGQQSSGVPDADISGNRCISLPGTPDVWAAASDTTGIGDTQ